MSAFPHLTLELANDDASLARLTFSPHPDTWVFDDTKGTRAQLKDDLDGTVAFVLSTLSPDGVFDDDAKQRIRTRVLYTLLQWVSFRGLVIPGR